MTLILTRNKLFYTISQEFVAKSYAYSIKTSDL